MKIVNSISPYQFVEFKHIWFIPHKIQVLKTCKNTNTSYETHTIYLTTFIHIFTHRSIGRNSYKKSMKNRRKLHVHGAATPSTLSRRKIPISPFVTDASRTMRAICERWTVSERDIIGKFTVGYPISLSVPTWDPTGLHLSDGWWKKTFADPSAGCTI